MVKHRNLISFMTTILLYAGIFGSYVYLMHTYVLTDQQAQDSTVQLSLTEFIPEVVPETEETEEAVVEEVVEEVPEPEPIVEKVIPQPITPKVIPLPAVKKPKVKKKKPRKKVKKKKKKKHPAVQREKGLKQQGSGHASSVSKNRFLLVVRQKINRNKSYPRIARRRGMQGAVNVRFTILANGHVGNISVKGPKVFHTSARRAIEKSFPISTKHIPVSLPQTVNLTLRYQLR